MAPHSSTLARKIPWTEEPGRLQSMGLLRVGHDWATSLSPFTFTHWRRKWQPTPVFLPGESQGQGSLVGCCQWGRTESDTTDATAAAVKDASGPPRSKGGEKVRLSTPCINQTEPLLLFNSCKISSKYKKIKGRYIAKLITNQTTESRLSFIKTR